MRDPNALRHERDGGRGPYDPNQPRVPAGDPKGGQFASKGYRGGDSGHDVGVTRASLDGRQLAQLGPGNPGAAYAQALPFDELMGFMSPAQHRASENGFIQTDNDPSRNRRMQDFETAEGRYKFVSQGPVAVEQIRGGTRWIISSTTYAHDRATGAYATISATPARPMMITDSYGQLLVRPFIRQFDSK